MRETGGEKQGSLTKLEGLHGLFQIHNLRTKISNGLVPKLNVFGQVRDHVTALRTIDQLGGDAGRKHVGSQWWRV